MNRTFLAAFLIANTIARGADVKPGTPIPFEAELSVKAKAMALPGGNPPVLRARCAVALPEKFSPSRMWPIVIVNAPIGSSAVEAVKDYAPAASAAGWVTLAAEGATPAKLETTEWCHAMLIAAFEHLEKSWPGVARWPVASAGFSGGAKRAAYIGAVMIEDGHPLMTSILVENVTGGMGTVAFVALIMSLCDHRYTATQFALDRKSTRLNSSHGGISRMPSSA